MSEQPGADEIEGVDPEPSTSPPPAKKTKLWEQFDQRTKPIGQVISPQAAAIDEVRKYLAENHLTRLGNPIRWWI